MKLRFLFYLCLLTTLVNAQDIFKDKLKPTKGYSTIDGTIIRSEKAVVIDGKLNDAIWQRSVKNRLVFVFGGKEHGVKLKNPG